MTGQSSTGQELRPSCHSVWPWIPGLKRLPAGRIASITLTSPCWPIGILTWRRDTESISTRFKPKMCPLISNL